jgi:hypothetical protein
MKCVVDKIKYTSKPQGYEPGSIIKRMTIDTMMEYSVQEIKQNILDGKTIRPSYCGGKEESWKSQQIFMIDIDNKPQKPKGMGDNDYEALCQQYLKDKHRTYSDLADHCKKINLIPNIIYTSFNHKPEHHKMRLVYVLDKEITDHDIAKRMQLYLMNAVGEVDEQCKNLNRIYYAGKNIVFDSGNILNSDKIIKDSKDIEVKGNKVKDKVNKENKGSPLISSPIESDGGERGTIILNKLYNSSNIIVPLNPPQPIEGKQDYNDTYNIKAITNRDIDYLKNKINNECIEFESVSEFWYYVYHNINMADLLEFKYPSSIRCIFHNDFNPSASIFQNDEGVWLYKCHSGKCGLTMNIKQLIEKLGNFKSEYRAIEFIKNIYNLSIKETSWSIEQKANLDSILYNLDMNTFSELCPQADKNIRYVKELFSTMIHIAKDNVYGENYMNSEGDVVFFVSLSELAKIMKVYANNHNKISQRIAVLIYHNLIKKLDDNKIPEAMLKRARAISIDRNNEKRVNFYSIPSWVFEHLNNVELQGNKWKKNGYTIKGVSYEMFYRGEGLEVAQSIYPQHKKVRAKTVDYDTGEIKHEIVDRTTSKKSNDRVDKIVGCISKLIEEKNYTTEKEIIRSLSDDYLWEITELQLRKMRGELEKLGYKRIRANKEIKEQMEMTGDGYPFLIVKGV